jgi:methyl-accepting chemotaxis protein
MNSSLAGITDRFQAETESISQINAAMGQISCTTQSQASTSEETASAAEQLRAQNMSVRECATELLGLVEGVR